MIGAQKQILDTRRTLRIFPVENREARPCPLQTVVLTVHSQEHLVVRRWTNESGNACRLCDGCNFEPCEDGQGVCTVISRVPVSPAAAPTFAARDL